MDKRIEKTRGRLRKALAQLVKDRPIEQISVSELCEKAGINRTTFYKYYAVPEDIQRELMDEIVDSLLQEMGREEPAMIGELMKKSCRMFSENWDLTGTPGYHLIMKMMEKMMKNMRRPDMYRGDQLYFLAGGTAAILERWSREDVKTRRSPDEIAEELTEYISRFLLRPKKG